MWRFRKRQFKHDPCLEDLVGAKFEVVLGYQGGSQTDLAIERGEVVAVQWASEHILAGSPLLFGIVKILIGI